ncbi:MAG: lytic transglycosylase domain-containing protein [Minwuia sp.]|nr:lytic transglycosylase domain-containing protein [Minwuia sp.]
MDRITPLIIAAAAIIAPAHSAPLDQFQAHIKEASQRFAIPAKWIEAVIMAESNGDPKAISPKGAMGLMQLMPGTWEELREQHGLGAYAYDPRTNILAGTAYLKAMYERFGTPGLFAAYNAGPGRYAEHLRTGKPLPAETRAYVAGLEAALADAPETAVTNAKASPSPAQNSPQIAFDARLFFPISTGENSDNPARNGELFVPLSTQKSGEK